jgi:hypothetical protein
MLAAAFVSFGETKITDEVPDIGQTCSIKAPEIQ